MFRGQNFNVTNRWPKLHLLQDVTFEINSFRDFQQLQSLTNEPEHGSFCHE
jgi:hypothetical protein